MCASHSRTQHRRPSLSCSTRRTAHGKQQHHRRQLRPRLRPRRAGVKAGDAIKCKHLATPPADGEACSTAWSVHALVRRRLERERCGWPHSAHSSVGGPAARDAAMHRIPSGLSGERGPPCCGRRTWEAPLRMSLTSRSSPSGSTRTDDAALPPSISHATCDRVTNERRGKTPLPRPTQLRPRSA